MGRPLIDLKNQRFGSWRVVSYAGEKRWNCVCDCGTYKDVSGHHLRGGTSTSCGTCDHHNMSGTRVYNIWRCMRDRCNNPNTPHFNRYGGRGIVHCDEWSDFRNFYADMGEPPTELHTLDRIDNNLGYSKDNCRWATRAEQAANRNITRELTHNGKTQTIREWASELKIPARRIRSRLEKGASTSDALTPGYMDGAQLPHMITFNGKTQNISAWANEIGLKPKTLSERLRKGWPIDRALSEGLRINQYS